VFSIILAAGWPIWPLLFASIIAVALIIERVVALRRSKVLPAGLLQRVIAEYQQQGISATALASLEAQSPLGRVLAAGLRNVGSSREIMRESIEEAGSLVAHELERYLTTLGTIASISPLMGLFGTVVGMIEIFGSQSPTGTNPLQLAHGISVAPRDDLLAPFPRAGQWLRPRDAAAGGAAGRGLAWRAQDLSAGWGSEHELSTRPRTGCARNQPDSAD